MSMIKVLNHVVPKLIEQGGPAYDREGCHYRLPDGRKCAVGHLIPDHLYIEDIEGMIVSGIDLDRFLPAFAQDAGVEFLEEFQLAHDLPAIDGEDWLPAFKAKVNDLAMRYNLDYQVN